MVDFEVLSAISGLVSVCFVRGLKTYGFSSNGKYNLLFL